MRNSTGSITDEAEFNKENYRPVNAATGEELKLQMQDVFLSGRVTLAGAHLVVKHTFTSSEKAPVEVIYSFVLPRDAALRQFRVVGKGFCCRSELKPVKEAEAKYEEGISKGNLSVLSKLYRDGYVNLNVGNIRPGETVAVFLEIVAGVDLRDDGLRFRFPFTLAPCYHPQARVSTDGSAGEIELPEDEFGDVILPPVHKDAKELHTVGFDLLVQVPDAVAQVSSPSHSTGFENVATGKARVQLSIGHDVPNRDLVLDVSMKSAFSGVLSGADRTGRGHFAAIIASSRFGEVKKGKRRLVFVYDRSGSMEGEPIRQAGNAVRACIGALDAGDEIGFVAFDNNSTLFRDVMCKADDKTREALGVFVGNVHTQGGTELLQAINAASKLIGKGGDIFLLTDGQVSGTETIIAGAKKAGIRIHCLGIGSASQDRFMTLIARETGGVSSFVTPNERVDMAALKLFTAIGSPAADEVSVHLDGLADASIAPVPQATVFSGHPLLVMGSCAKGRGSVVVEWIQDKETKKITLPLKVDEGSLGSTLRLLRGSRLITDLEAGFESATPDSKSARKEVQRMEKALEALGQEYGLANRAMALVAVVKRAGDQPGQVPKTMVVPLGMPEGQEFSAYYGEISPAAERLYCSCVSDSAPSFAGRPPSRRSRSKMSCDSVLYAPPERGEDPTEVLLRLVAMIRADGGMPGSRKEARIVASILLMLALAEDLRGIFAPHIGRILGFLKSGAVNSLSNRQIKLTEQIISLIKAGKSIRGPWLEILMDKKNLSPGKIVDVWDCLDRAVGGS